MAPNRGRPGNPRSHSNLQSVDSEPSTAPGRPQVGVSVGLSFSPPGRSTATTPVARQDHNHDVTSDAFWALAELERRRDATDRRQ